ncbi:flagellar basal body P-ring formation chaperone FlgA [Polynucleobacter sp. AP-Sanab-80-C2]|uniref:flagellar basal body P-ring formation chaperone FlgA n=1 Tax=Polynucleobacter sp. AP-Sanab-80-C2 TaxID=3108274 RepID=UPI002B229203|nr:flagellar basal body P-ring formation chaperone FlgA [Polynucleobacter sp. AP-Sanab-80-C2]MEA9599090.1 flagellar basal body P-ring formation chaperone FlgA [Polynucleobacter sp. AP-Sanab-80-C2]
MHSSYETPLEFKKSTEKPLFGSFLHVFETLIIGMIASVLLSFMVLYPKISWAQVQNQAPAQGQNPGSNSATNAGNPPAFQNLRIINQKVKDFLTTQSAGSPGKPEITVTPMEEGTQLTYCPSPEAFFPPNSAAWGRTTVGVRCGQPKPWTVYVQANVSIIANYVVAGAPIGQGQTISANELQLQKGDLTILPAGIFTEFNRVIGQTARMSLVAGTVLKKEMLKMPLIVQKGQSVRVSSGGKGFSISTDGQALNEASEGELVKVKVSNGSVVTGIAKENGVVEVGGQSK